MNCNYLFIHYLWLGWSEFYCKNGHPNYFWTRPLCQSDYLNVHKSTWSFLSICKQVQMMPYPRPTAWENNPLRKSVSPFHPGTGLNSLDEIDKITGLLSCADSTAPPTPAREPPELGPPQLQPCSCWPPQGHSPGHGACFCPARPPVPLVLHSGGFTKKRLVPRECWPTS